MPSLPLTARRSFECGLVVAVAPPCEHGWEVVVTAASLIQAIYLAVGFWHRRTFWDQQHSGAASAF